MSELFFAIGLTTGLPLIALLVVTWLDLGARIWPTPEPGSWQSILFWPLFRTLNVSAFATAAVSTPGLLALPDAVRLAALLLLLAAGALYVFALIALGHANTYCERQGLVTRGIYRWTRNPQYAAIIPVYAGLAFAADSGPTAVLCSALIIAYVLMALNEEPWLLTSYGADYQRYCRRVPRFFNWRRAWVLARSTLRHLDRTAASRLADLARPWQTLGGGRRRL